MLLNFGCKICNFEYKLIYYEYKCDVDVIIRINLVLEFLWHYYRQQLEGQWTVSSKKEWRNVEKSVKSKGQSSHQIRAIGTQQQHPRSKKNKLIKEICWNRSCLVPDIRVLKFKIDSKSLLLRKFYGPWWNWRKFKGGWRY